MKEIFLIDRKTKKKILEKVYGQKALAFLYQRKNPFGKNPLACICLYLVSHFSIFSRLYGVFQKTSHSKKKIEPFISQFHVDEKEFEKTSFSSFNDFFIRKLKPSARPVVSGDDIAVLPADGRYMVFPQIDREEGFYVKGKKFCLNEFFASCRLAKKYANGSMVIARLAPPDYHRFHFPIDCVPSKPVFINGYLYSVNPVAIQKNVKIFSENKRMITTLRSDVFGEVLFVEVGATNVGSIHQTFRPRKEVKKGEEKGYFSFGGSAIVLFFEKDKICFDQDLLDNSSKKIETKALFGQRLGKVLS